jgi:hypothetical protein
MEEIGEDIYSKLAYQCCQFAAKASEQRMQLTLSLTAPNLILLNTFEKHVLDPQWQTSGRRFFAGLDY